MNSLEIVAENNALYDDSLHKAVIDSNLLCDFKKIQVTPQPDGFAVGTYIVLKPESRWQWLADSFIITKDLVDLVSDYCNQTMPDTAAARGLRDEWILKVSLLRHNDETLFLENPFTSF
ncbi:hypothetical protein A6E01_20605 (plasmid) [Vibrio breoganii]|uniref:Uncharacterized protein n=1 Tax=Vibrio breoganii TaxID=553239 RepID=A0A193KK06_9VIBR|nr:hypothetical protein [Vibrio breoganii]ANO35615.1 hypothetical protein A6E01_20605 [Vibrio breoganii]